MKSKRSDSIKLTLLALIGAMLVSTEVTAAEPAKDVTASNPAAQDSSHKKMPYFAKVGDTKIYWLDYDNEYNKEAKKKFYHGKPGEAAVAVFQREIANTLVTNAMLVQEAKRRKLKPDNTVVKQQLDEIDHTNAQNPNWPASRPRVLPIIEERLQNENLRIQLETLVYNVPPPSVKQLRKYYDAHPEKFTSPPQQRVSTILLRVDPSAPDADWQKAIEQGQNLVKRLRAGEDFAELARDYSGDVTAEEGGDMGYLHEGMLPGLPALTVAKLQPGETSDPVTLMEGVAIFRLTDRKPAETSSFKSVQQRAKELWLTEQREKSWNSLITKLKKNTPVQVNESRFLPLPVSNNKPAESPDSTKP